MIPLIAHYVSNGIKQRTINYNDLTFDGVPMLTQFGDKPALYDFAHDDKGNQYRVWYRSPLTPDNILHVAQVSK